MVVLALDWHIVAAGHDKMHIFASIAKYLPVPRKKEYYHRIVLVRRVIVDGSDQ